MKTSTEFNGMETDGPAKLIVCIVPQGKGTDLIAQLSSEKDIHSANVSTGRGRGAGTVGSIGAWDEVDVLHVTVPIPRADEIFDFLFEVGELNQPRGGIIYQHGIAPVTTFTLPEVAKTAAD